MSKSDITIIGTVFTKKGIEGDFEWQIMSGKYEDALFLFNDDEIRHYWKKAGRGNAVIRRFNSRSLEKPRSHGIVTGRESGYASLTPEVKHNIDLCIQEAIHIIKKFGYTKIYYSASEPNGPLGTSIFQIGDDVRSYITEQIHNLKNII